ncbi:hypothetical protein ACQ4PT_053188 [Festuca glaucescens]
MGFHASSAIAALLLAALAIAATPRGASAVVQCGQVTQLMAPCMPYLGGAPGMTPYGICCNSLGVLNQLAATTADRVAACNCVKAAATGFPSVDFGRAAALPGACGLSISFVVTPNMDWLLMNHETELENHTHGIQRKWSSVAPESDNHIYSVQ